MAPVIAAAALTAIGGLMQNMMAQQSAKEAQQRAERLAREQAARDQVTQAQQNQLSAVKSMGSGEQGALGNLMAALARTAR